MRQTDIAIVGAGPIGIEMAVALKQHGYNFAHFEAGNIGSTMNWWAPETVFFSSSDRISIAGVPLGNQQQAKASREEYLTYLRNVVQQFSLNIETYQRVTGIERTSKGFLLTISESSHGVGGKEEYLRSKEQPVCEAPKTVSAQKLILAIGDMHRPNTLNIPGEDLAHVSHFLDDPHRYFGKKVVIVGGQNSAVEAAIRLVRVGADVTLSYRAERLNQKRIKFWLYPEFKSLVRRGLLEFLPKTCPVQIRRGAVELCSATEDGRPSHENTRETAADFVLLLTGYCQDPTLYQQAGITLEGSGKKPVINPDTMQTDVSGIYVAGTGSAGTQMGGVKEFIETSHVHVRRIIAHLEGKEPPQEELNELSQREI